MGPVELSLKNRAQEIHRRLMNTRPPDNSHLQAIIDNLREELAKANAKIERYESNKRTHPIHRIIDLVCQTEKIPRVDLLSERRTMYLCRGRHIAYFLAATTTVCSLPQIGAYFGGRDHTTVLHGRDKIKNIRLRDEVLDAKLKWYENRLAEEFVDKRGA